MKSPGCCERSLHMHHGLRTDGRKIGLGAVTGADLDESEVGVTGCCRLEGEGGDTSLAVDASYVRRTGGGNGDETIALITMDDRDCLTVTTEQVASVDIDEFEDTGIELDLERYRIDDARSIEHDGNLESTAYGLVSSRSVDGKAYG